MPSLSELLLALPQYGLPQHALSRLMGKITRCRNPRFKDLFIRNFIKAYRVRMDEAVESDPAAYGCFNEFFTRALRPEARPHPADPDALLCPADGTLSQFGTIRDGRLIQAKGKDFSLVDLLGGSEERAKPFVDGAFATVYLSPRDYHRLHMPLAGTLREMVLIPGRLFSVNQATTAAVPNLFARNERVAAIFDTEAGPMAMVLVGAIFVASIETVWHGVVTPPAGTAVKSWRYDDNPVRLEKGAEMGRFNMGSTIVLVMGKDRVAWPESFAEGLITRVNGDFGRVIR